MLECWMLLDSRLGYERGEVLQCKVLPGSILNHTALPCKYRSGKGTDFSLLAVEKAISPLTPFWCDKVSLESQDPLLSLKKEIAGGQVCGSVGWCRWPPQHCPSLSSRAVAKITAPFIFSSSLGMDVYGPLSLWPIPAEEPGNSLWGTETHKSKKIQCMKNGILSQLWKHQQSPARPCSLLQKQPHQLWRHHLSHQALLTIETVTGPYP